MFQFKMLKNNTNQHILVDCYAECYYTEWYSAIQNVITMSIVMLSVIMLKVIVMIVFGVKMVSGIVVNVILYSDIVQSVFISSVVMPPVMAPCLPFIHTQMFNQGTLAEVEGSIQLASFY